MVAVLAAASALVGVVTPVQAFDRRQPAETRDFPYTGTLPACEDPSVVGLVTRRFDDREENYFGSILRIAEVRDIHTLGYRPDGLDLIPRRYCAATAITSDLIKRQLYYFVVEDASIIGWTWGVEYCVSGLDVYYSYDGRCRAARPGARR